MVKIRKIIETHFGLVLLVSCVVGLAVPAISALPDFSAPLALAMLTYASCFKLADGGFSQINWRRVGVFYVLRYVLLPALLLLIARKLFPDYAVGVFLLALMPTAVSSPAFAHMFGGRVPTAFAIVILSTTLAPFLIPLECSLLADMQNPPSPFPLFRTLAFCVFIPMVFYFLSRGHEKIHSVMYKNVKLISIILVAFVIALVISKQREFILGHAHMLIVPSLLTISCFIIFLASGWFFARKLPSGERISFAACSGFNNVALGVSVALLHFPQDVIVFVAVSEAAWAMLPIMFRVLFIRGD